MVNLHLLRAFYMVVNTGGVSSAAEALFISQPAVSNALKRLQKEYHVQLFHKVGRSLSLTEDGARLHAALEQLFAAENKVDALLQQMHSQGQRNIKLGLVTIYERFGVTDILRRFAAINPRLSISIHSGNSAAVLEMLQDRAIDLAIGGSVPAPGPLISTPYMRHDLFLVIPPGHRLSGRSTFTREDIRGERMVLKEPGSAVRRMVDGFLQQCGLDPVVVMELSNIDSILSLARKENCLTFLPDMSLRENITTESPLGVARCQDMPDFFFLTYIISHPLSSYPDSTAEIIARFRENVAADPPGLT